MNNTDNIRREVLVRLIRAYLSENFEKTTDKIPYEMRPKHCEVPYRCCIHKERFILRGRTIAGLGFPLEKDDESLHLEEYARMAKERTEPENQILTVIDTACKSCTPSKIHVTDLCQGCVARPCVGACPFKAISLINGKSVIDEQKCKKCGKCIPVCPYKAITKICVPCEDACPVNAIKKNAAGYAEINFEKCISCGRCISACPFGTVNEISQLIDILKALKSGKKMVAMVAPSIVGQFPCSWGQIAEGLKKAGFSKIIEVALGADITALNEAGEFEHRMKKGDPFMTTSCCAAYKELVEKQVPELGPYISETQTPLYYTAKLVKKENPEDLRVFIGPCLAKRREGLKNPDVDYVMSFEEMGALFIALGIDVMKCADLPMDENASAEGRSFAITGGVSHAVKAACRDKEGIIPVCVNGLNHASIKMLRECAGSGACPSGNLIEIMACEGGCVGGSGTINSAKITTQKIKKYSEESEKLNPELHDKRKDL